MLTHGWAHARGATRYFDETILNAVSKSDASVAHPVAGLSATAVLHQAAVSQVLGS
jgi:hypothetical protein